MANMFSDALDLILQDRNIEGDSINWTNWQSVLQINTCKPCAEEHGTIYTMDYLGKDTVPYAHENCQCDFVRMRTKEVGTATEKGFEGADAYLMYTGKLPDYYVTKEEAKAAGWKSKKGNLDDVLPGKMFGGNIFYNEDEKLPTEANRVWYEADIDYEGGYRNRKRLLYSSDGLIFASYDHYRTFYEIIK